MMEYVDVINYLNESVRIYLTDDDPASGFIITSIKGLNPPKANINISEISTIDGGIPNSERLGPRNIIITIRYTPAMSIEETRLRVYKYFPIKRPVTLIIKTQFRTLQTIGYVEYNNVEIFSKDEESDISIICPDPYLYSNEEYTTVFNGSDPAFKFPFSNNSLTEKKIKFGSLYDQHEKTVIYNGDAEIGITIIMHAMGTVRNVVIYNAKTRAVMRIDTNKIKEITGSEIIVGDDIIINSTIGDKYIHLIRGGETFNIIRAIEKDSDWFTLTKGENIFAYAADFGEFDLKFKIINRSAYEGA